jgi:hypothetical protein
MDFETPLLSHLTMISPIFNAYNGQELIFLKPRTTLIYPTHVPKYP